MGVEPIWTALQAVLALTNHRVSSTPQFSPHEFAGARLSEAEYATLEKTGTAVVTGQVFLKTRAGDVKPGADNVVYLNPPPRTRASPTRTTGTLVG